MQIELFGCTSAGKSRLLQQILNLQAGRRPALVRSDDLLLQQLRLQWVAGTARLILLNLLSISLCIAAWRKYRDFLHFVIARIGQLRGKVPLVERLRILRITLRNVGLHEGVERYSVAGDAVFTDEGMLQIAHYLFVHVQSTPKAEHVLSFAALVPLPTLAIYVSEPNAVLIERTAARGHKRIPAGSPELIERFVTRATAMFRLLTQQSRIKNRLLTINNQQLIRVANEIPDSDVSIAADLIGPALRGVNQEKCMDVC